jgi:hypothetical protein
MHPHDRSRYDRCNCGEKHGRGQILWNCGRCGYLALSAPAETEGAATYEHRCPKCREAYWLDHETWSRMKGHWTDPHYKEAA